MLGNRCCHFLQFIYWIFGTVHTESQFFFLHFISLFSHFQSLIYLINHFSAKARTTRRMTMFVTSTWRELFIVEHKRSIEQFNKRKPNYLLRVVLEGSRKVIRFIYFRSIRLTCRGLWHILYTLMEKIFVVEKRASNIFVLNKTYHHDITEILLKVALNTIKQPINLNCEQLSRLKWKKNCWSIAVKQPQVEYSMKNVIVLIVQ